VSLPLYIIRSTKLLLLSKLYRDTRALFDELVLVAVDPTRLVAVPSSTIAS